MEQVIQASNRGDELNDRADDVHAKFTPETSSQSRMEAQEPQPSASGLQKAEKRTKTDEECLTATEQEYLARRDERLERLEAESKAYLDRMKQSLSHRRCGSEPQENDSASKIAINEEKPSTSVQQKTEGPTLSKTDEQCLTATEQEYLARRDERLKRLEAESQAYLNRMKSMSHRAASVDTKLDTLRERCGQIVENRTNSIDTNATQTVGESLNQEEQTETDESTENSPDNDAEDENTSD